MLVLSRKVSERILIGGDVVVTVVRVQGDKVRIGVEAPDDVAIVREEIVGREQAEDHPVAIKTPSHPQRPRKVAV